MSSLEQKEASQPAAKAEYELPSANGSEETLVGVTKVQAANSVW